MIKINIVLLIIPEIYTHKYEEILSKLQANQEKCTGLPVIALCANWRIDDPKLYFIVIDVTYLFVVIGTDTTEIKGPKKDVSNDGTIANVPVLDVVKKLHTILQNFPNTNLP